MLIVCPSCTTAYRIELSTLGVSGRSVRCARCRHVWFTSAVDAVTATLDTPLGHDAVSSAVRPDRPSAGPAAEAGASEAANGLVDWSPDDASPRAGRSLTDAPSLVPSLADMPHDGALTASGEDIETRAALRARVGQGRKRRRVRLRLPGLPTVILGLVAALAAIVNWRASVVHVVPQTASLFGAIGLPVNLRGLEFGNVKTSVEFHDGMSVLLLEGTIANVARQAVEVPRLRFAVRNSAGFEVYAWTALPAKSVLSPGDAVPFRTRLASPPVDGREVIIRFFTRRDVVAGAR